MAYDPRTYAMYRSMELRAQRLEDAAEASILRANIAKISQQIRNMLTQEQYDAWWTSTPDDDEGYYLAAVRKITELRMVEREPEDKLFASCILEAIGASTRA